MTHYIQIETTEVLSELTITVYDSYSNVINTESIIPTLTSFNYSIGSLNGYYYVQLKSNGELIGQSEVYAYTNEDKDLNFYFTRKNKYKLFVECGFKPSGYEVKDEVSDYDKQSFTNKRVYSMPYDVKKLTIGSVLGVPNYEFKKIARIFACDNVLIGDTEYFPAKESIVEIEENTCEGLNILKINLQQENTHSEYDQITGKVFDDTFDETFN